MNSEIFHSEFKIRIGLSCSVKGNVLKRNCFFVCKPGIHCNAQDSVLFSNKKKHIDFYSHFESGCSKALRKS